LVTTLRTAFSEATFPIWGRDRLADPCPAGINRGGVTHRAAAVVRADPP
jgi:hypothetical protein